MRLFAVCLLVVLSQSVCFGLGQDQLYTGSASTVPAGKVQFQLYYNTPFSHEFRLTGTSFTFGASNSVDVKIGYGYLWTTRGPNTQIGPNIGAKWRFVGDGRRKTSLSVTGLYVLNRLKGDASRDNDFGTLLVFQYPSRYVILLANYGHVWVGGPTPDLGYTAVALAKPVSRRLLLAAQYIDINQFGSAPPNFHDTLYVAAAVYHVPNKYGYSVQLGYRPEALQSRANITLGYSLYL